MIPSKSNYTEKVQARLKFSFNISKKECGTAFKTFQINTYLL